MHPNTELYKHNLRITRQYCDFRLQHFDKGFAKLLRSINPEFNDRAAFNLEKQESGYFSCKWNMDLLEPGILIWLFKKQIAYKTEKYTTADTEYNGKVLVCEFEYTVTDGGSEYSSEGLIDSYDLPPIDTWFYIAENNAVKMLYAWIPDECISFIDEAIKDNPLGLIYRLSDDD